MTDRKNMPIEECVAEVEKYIGCPGFGDWPEDQPLIDRTMAAAKWALANGYKEPK